MCEREREREREFEFTCVLHPEIDGDKFIKFMQVEIEMRDVVSLNIFH